METSASKRSTKNNRQGRIDSGNNADIGQKSVQIQEQEQFSTFCARAMAESSRHLIVSRCVGADFVIVGDARDKSLEILKDLYSNNLPVTVK